MDYRAVAHMTRWALADTLHQLDFIPEDRFAWKPAEGMKSAADIVGEIVMVFHATQPIFEGGTMVPAEAQVPASREEGKSALQAAGEAYAAALESVDPATLGRTLDTFMGPLAADTSVLYPAIELIHHHGQITYLQGLVGDHEVHMNMAALQAYFGPRG